MNQMVVTCSSMTIVYQGDNAYPPLWVALHPMRNTDD